MLSVTNLSFERNELEIFTDLSFSLLPGEILEVQGANGSGKTSLLRILAGLSWASAGEIYWQGRLVTFPDSEFFSAILYLGHSVGLKTGLSVRENLQLAKQLSSGYQGISVEQALQQLGMSAYADTLIERLSAGQKRRAALTKLLMVEAAIWLLDEPVVALDGQGIECFSTILNHHLKQGGIAVVTSHHPLALTDVKIKRVKLES